MAKCPKVGTLWGQQLSWRSSWGSGEMVSSSPHHHHIATPIAHSPALFSERLGRRTLGLGRTMVIKGEGSRSSCLPAWAGVWGYPGPCPPPSGGCDLHPSATCFVIRGPNHAWLPPSPVCLLPPSHPPLSLPPHPLPRAHGGKRPLVASSPLLPHLTPVLLVVTGARSGSRSITSDSSRPHGLQPPRLLCPRDSPGKSPGVGCRSLLQGTLPDPGTEPRCPALAADSLLSEHARSGQSLK